MSVRLVSKRIMEPLTQATIGSVAAIALTQRTPISTAFWIGALGGFLPDADVFIRSSEDPLLHLEYHRHFTHSLLFIPIGGFITAVLGQLITRGKQRIRKLWVPASLGWATHGLLDSCTSYGTHLLWPFSEIRMAWHNVSIVDPLYTLPLLVLVLLSVRRDNRTLSRIALCWSFAYLTFGLLQRNRATSIYQEIAVSRGHVTTDVSVKPSFGNNILFRGFYVYNNRFFADSIRVPWFGEHTVYEGTSIERLDFDTLYESADHIHKQDLTRFQFFSNGYLVEDPLHKGIIGDFRYAMLPNAVAPMWGIDFGNRQANTHMEFIRFTKLNKSERTEFFRQLRGE